MMDQVYDLLIMVRASVSRLLTLGNGRATGYFLKLTNELGVVWKRLRWVQKSGLTEILLGWLLFNMATLDIVMVWYFIG